MALEAQVIALTEPKGETVFVVTSWILAIRAPYLHEAQDNVKAVVCMSGFNLLVQEPPVRVAFLMGAS